MLHDRCLSCLCNVGILWPIAQIFQPHAYLVPLLGVSPWVIQQDLWLQMTRIPNLQRGVVYVIAAAVLMEHGLVTDRRTATGKRHRPQHRP